jgi:hypothetical protein
LIEYLLDNEFDDAFDEFIKNRLIQKISEDEIDDGVQFLHV